MFSIFGLGICLITSPLYRNTNYRNVSLFKTIVRNIIINGLNLSQDKSTVCPVESTKNSKEENCDDLANNKVAISSKQLSSECGELKHCPPLPKKKNGFTAPIWLKELTCSERKSKSKPNSKEIISAKKSEIVKYEVKEEVCEEEKPLPPPSPVVKQNNCSCCCDDTDKKEKEKPKKRKGRNPIVWLLSFLTRLMIVSGVIYSTILLGVWGSQDDTTALKENAKKWASGKSDE